MKFKNIAFIVAVLGFAIGFSDLQENIFFWLGRPIGAIAFIVFLISMFLEKEYALLDEQERTKLASLPLLQKQSASKESKKGDCAPALTTAAIH